jgi:5'-3' exonuclease
MGIKNLTKFLREKCPEIFEEIHISQLQYTKAITDFSLYLFKYKTIFGNDGWISAMINLISCLRRNEVHAIFAFDGGAPGEKMQERQERREKRDKLDKKIETLQRAFDRAKTTGEIDQILIDLVGSKEESMKRRRLLGSSSSLSFSLSSSASSKVDLDSIEIEIERISKQSVKLSQADFDTAKKVFELLGVPYFQAPLEGESLCADLCVRKQVDYVITEDSDVFAYGCPVLITKVNTATDTCVIVHQENILKALDLTQAEFLDFCIMCSCDYNKNIPGIGPGKAFNLIKQHRSIEAITANTSLDVSILNHVRVRELFTKIPPFEEPIPFCKPADFPAFEKFLFENNVHVNVSRIKKDFAPKMQFSED